MASASHVSDHSHGDFNSKHKLYMKVFGYLFLLTILEVAAFEMHRFGWSRVTIGVLVTIMASIKAWLVAYYYMHLNHETKWTKIVAAVPLIVVIYAVVLVLEAPHSAKPSDYLPLKERAAAQSSEHGASKAAGDSHTDQPPAAE